MTNKKTITISLAVLVLGIFLISFTSASTYFWKCFNYGEKVNYCAGGSIPGSSYNYNDFTCSQETGCQECMSNYYPNYDGGCYVHGSPLTRCYATGTQCSNIGGGNITGDSNPPILKISSPVNNPSKYYSSRKILLNFSLNEVADVYYKDLNKNTNTWTKVCDNCKAGNPSYSMNRSFSEGENNLMFKAVDVIGNGNNLTQTITFNVDSVSPRIYKTYPLNGFANGDFEVQFKEANPKKLTLYYGNASYANKSKNLNLATECTGPDASGKTYCETSADLSQFNGKDIKYYFEIEDIAGKVYKSRVIKLKVDTKSPVVNNPNSFYTVNGRYVTFNMSITEDNFYKVTYVNNSNPVAVKTLCTSLKNGLCQKKVSFIKGNYTLSVQVTDKAGNPTIALPAKFSIY
jgi:hypothetical protein